MRYRQISRTAALLIVLLALDMTSSLAATRSAAASLAASFNIYLPIVLQPAQTPQLLAPANNDRSSLAPILSWTLPMTGTYQVQVSTDMTFATMVLSKTLKYSDPKTTVGSNVADNSNLAEQTPFFWRVGVLFDGSYMYSPVRTFITPQASSVTLPAQPEVFDATPLTDTVTVSWKSVPNVLFYRVNIDSSTQKGVASALVAAPVTIATISGLLPGTAYTWRVRALNASGWGADAKAPAFTTHP